MAKVMTLSGDRKASGQKSAWRFFPYAVSAALGVVTIVNAFMIYHALSSFPGQPGDDANGYDISNEYNHILEANAAQAALGWKLVMFGSQGHVVIRLTGRDGAAVQISGVTGMAARPVGPESKTALSFTRDAQGRWVSLETLPLGQWHVDVSAQGRDRDFLATRRLIIR